MVYMGGKGKNNASRSNQITHFGIMGGLAPSTNIAQGVKRFRLRRARNKQTIPLMPVPGLEYMKERDILSKNPAGSGGVGLSKVLVDRSMGPCNCGGGNSPVPDGSLGATDTICSDCNWVFDASMTYDTLYLKGIPYLKNEYEYVKYTRRPSIEPPPGVPAGTHIYASSNPAAGDAYLLGYPGGYELWPGRDVPGRKYFGKVMSSGDIAWKCMNGASACHQGAEDVKMCWCPPSELGATDTICSDCRVVFDQTKIYDTLYLKSPTHHTTQYAKSPKADPSGVGTLYEPVDSPGSAPNMVGWDNGEGGISKYVLANHSGSGYYQATTSSIVWDTVGFSLCWCPPSELGATDDPPSCCNDVFRSGAPPPPNIYLKGIGVSAAGSPLPEDTYVHYTYSGKLSTGVGAVYKPQSGSDRPGLLYDGLCFTVEMDPGTTAYKGTHDGAGHIVWKSGAGGPGAGPPTHPEPNIKMCWCD